MPDEGDAKRRLVADGFLREDAGRLRTTRTWQTAMARAALHLYAAHDAGDDMRIPVAMATVALYGESLSDEELAMVVEVMMPIEEAELHPRV